MQRCDGIEDDEINVEDNTDNSDKPFRRMYCMKQLEISN